MSKPGRSFWIGSLCISFCSFSLLFPKPSGAAWEHSAKLGLGYEHFTRLSPVADASGATASAELGLQWVKGNWRFSERGSGIYRPGVRDLARSSNGDFQEFFFEYIRSSWVFQLGLNSVNWGSTDFNNPLDVVNSRIIESVLSPIKRGAPMLRIEKTFNNWAVEALWIPNQVPTLLPSNSSRWLPRDSLPGRFVGSIDSPLGVVRGFLDEDPTQYKIKNPKFLNNPQKNNVGARLTGRLGETDLQLIYHEGLATTPSVNVSTEQIKNVQLVPPLFAIGPTIDLEPEFAKYRTAGVATASTIGSWILKLAYAKSQSLTKEIPLQDLHAFATSIETSRSFWTLDWNFLLQNYQVYQRSLPSVSSLDTTTFFSMNEAMNQSWLLGIRASRGLSWSLLTGLQVSPFSKGGIGSFSFEKRLTETSKWFLNGELIDGQTGSSLHQLRSASRLHSGINLSW
jgi:hypothetical protein